METTSIDKRKSAAVIFSAAADGKEIQSLDLVRKEWRNIDPFEYASNVILYPDQWRIKPEPKTRPWSKPEDVPGPVCYLRSKGFSEGWSLITGARADESGSMDGVLLVGFRTGSRFVAWSELSEFEYSIDRKNWSPCVVTEEAK